METYASFLFWASVYLAILALAFLLLIKHVGTPRQNRYSILFGLAFVVMLPWMGQLWHVTESGGNAFAVFQLPEVFIGATAGLEYTRQGFVQGLESRHLYLYFSLMISALLAVRMLWSLSYLGRKIWLGERIRMKNCTLIPLKDGYPPFSFYGYVFIPRSLLSEAGHALEMVLKHEKLHIRRRHSTDLIILELFSLVFWFHPAIWYLRRQIKRQHEYEADRYVLDHQTDKHAYQYLLLGQAHPYFPVHNMVHTFSYKPLKHRIMKMNKPFKKNAPGFFSGMLLVVTAFFLVFSIHSCGLDNHRSQSESTLPTAPDVNEAEADFIAADQFVGADQISPSDSIYHVVQTPPRFPGGEEARIAFLQDHLRYPNEARLEGIQGTVFVNFVVRADGRIEEARILRGIGGGCDEETLRVIREMPAWEPGRNQDGQAVHTRFNMPVRFTLNE